MRNMKQEIRNGKCEWWNEKWDSGIMKSNLGIMKLKIWIRICEQRNNGVWRFVNEYICAAEWILQVNQIKSKQTPVLFLNH